MLRHFYLLLFTTIFSCTFIYGAEFLQCSNAPSGSFMAVSSNCSKAIYCNGVDSIILDCDKDSPYFSSADQKCHNITTVCDSRPFRLLNIPTTTTLSIPTVATSLAIMASKLPDNTNPTTTLSSITVPTEQNFPTTVKPTLTATTVREFSTPAMPVSTTSSIPIFATTQHVSVFVQCPAVDDASKPLFLPHPKSCAEFYLCYHGVATLMNCPYKLHFDANLQTCNTPDEAKCQLNFLISREKCLLNAVSFYPHPTNCNYYYLCEYGFLMVMQCPFNMYWDYRSRVCAIRSLARCYNTNSII